VHEERVERNKESLELVQPWRENSREIWSVLEHIGVGNLRNKLLGVKSEHLCELY
jgi:hypothetical protein